MTAVAAHHGARPGVLVRGLAAAVVAVVAVLTFQGPPPAAAATRIKDIVSFEGVRENQLVGYGLVVGLNGTGDRMRDGSFTKQSLMSMLNRLGVKPTEKGLESKNVAAVMVTASLPPFARHGSRVDVNVSALGNADSLVGGTLLVTPLLGADSEVYAVAQGQVGVGGFEAKGQGQSLTKGTPTMGRIADGAVVEREVGFELGAMTSVKLSLRNPDFTTARRVAQEINRHLGGGAAEPLDPSTVRLTVPINYQSNVVGMLTDIEQLRIQPDQLARVIIDPSNGIIVMGENVRVSTVAIAQGNLTIRITETPQVSQPQPFSDRGRTVVTPNTNIEADDGSDRRVGLMQEGVTIQDLVNGLNALGVGPRDLISILQAIKAAGALQAELEVM